MAVSFFRFKGRRRRKSFLFAAAAALLIFLGCAALADYIYYRSRIYPGVYAAGRSLGGATRAGGAAILEQSEITVTGPAGKQAAIPLRDMGIFVEKEQVLQAAYSRGRQLRWPLGYWERFRMAREKTFIPLEYRLDGDALMNSLSFFAEAFNTGPQDAHFRVCPYERQSKLIPEKPGYRIIKEELLWRLLLVLNRPGENLTVQAPYTEIPAALSARSLKDMGIETLMISFNTEFDRANANRVENLKIASAAIDGSLLAPGEIFSINALIGDTTPEKGYKEAPVILGGELVQGYGGGLCQVSSTLYNAALLADLVVLERHPHQFAIPYLPPGRDATIEYGSRDLVFRNNKNHHILINALILGDRLIFRLFGAPLQRRVEISTRELAVFEPPVRIRYDPDLPSGAEEVDEGTPGYVVEVWKTIYRNGAEESRVMISFDSYVPYPTVVRRGP